MNKKFLSVTLFSALMLGTAGTVSYTHLTIPRNPTRHGLTIQRITRHVTSTQTC